MRYRISAVALVVAFAVTSTVMTSSSASVESIPNADPDYVYSVNEIEGAAPVVERARKTLGNRFVEVWYADDQRSYVVGVLNLKASEVSTLEGAIVRTAPVRFVNRSTSREAVDRAVSLVKAEAVRTDYSDIHGWIPDYVAGIVFVDVDARQATAVQGKLTSARQKVRGADGDEETGAADVAPIVVDALALSASL